MADVSLILKAIDSASPVIKRAMGDINSSIKEVENSLKELDKAGIVDDDISRIAAGEISALEGMGAAITTVSSILGVAAGAALAFKAAMDMGEQAAQAERLATSFEFLAQSVGASATEMLDALREASDGTVSDLALMKTANSAMMLGVATTADQMANLLEIAAFRARAFGITTEQAFDDIVRGIGRASPQILDNLGIITRADETYTAYAEAIGKSKEELTAAEKTQALLNRVLEEGNKQLEEAGGLAEDSASQFERMDAQIANLGDTIRSKTLPVTTKLATIIGDVANMGADFIDAFSEVTAETNILAIGVDDLFRAFQRFGEIRIGRHNEELAAEAEAVNAAKQAWYDARYGVEEYTATVAESVDDSKAAAAAAKELSAALNDQLSSTEKIAEENQRFAEKQDEITMKQAALRQEINLLIAQGWSPLSTKVQNLEEDYANLGIKYDENAAKHREATNKILYDMLMQKLGMDGLTSAEFEMALAAGQAFGIFDQAAVKTASNMNTLTDAVAAGKLKVDDLRKAMDMVKNGMDVKVVLRIFQQVTGEAAMITAPSGANRNIEMRAEGGPVRAGQSYIVGERGPEMFTPGANGFISPNGAGGATVVNLTYAPAVSLASQQEVESVLLPFIRKGVRDVQAGR